MKKKSLLFILILFSPFIMGHTVKDENISVTVGDVETPVYSVDITWDSMEFTYKETVNYLWNSTNHTYELSPSTYRWETSNNNISINNKSNIPVNVELKYLSEKDNIKGYFSISKAKLAINENIKSKLTLDGELSSDNTNYIKVGTININIS